MHILSFARRQAEPAIGLGSIGHIWFCCLAQLFRSGHITAMLADQSQSQLMRGKAVCQLGLQAGFCLICLFCQIRVGQNPFIITGPDGICIWRVAPFSGNACHLQQFLSFAVAVIRHNNDRSPFTPGPAGTARPVQQHICGAWQVSMNNQIKMRQINPSGGNVSGHTDPGAPVPHRLYRLIAGSLIKVTRQRHNRQAAVRQPG